MKDSDLTDSILGSGFTNFKTRLIILTKFFLSKLKKFNPKLLSNLKSMQSKTFKFYQIPESIGMIFYEVTMIFV